MTKADKVKSILIGMIVLLLILPVVFSSDSAFAQSTTTGWSTPQNLSRSGSSSGQVIAVDAAGGVHVVWVDQFSGTRYAFGSNDKWTASRRVDFPFGNRQPELVSDGIGKVHAFWIDQTNRLLYSGVRGIEFAVTKQWSDVRTLADNVVAMQSFVDSKGGIHLGYVRNAELPDGTAGVYYTVSRDGGASWQAPVYLFGSPYYRGIRSDEASVSVSASGDASAAFITWDNRARKQVFFSRSLDGGRKWETPLEISKPTATSTSAAPLRIQVAGAGTGVLILWQDGTSLANCTQYYQWSVDRGSNWSKRQVMFEDVRGCAQSNNFLVTGDNFILLASTVQERLFLTAFNGSQWSPAQPQDALNNFADPETFKAVNYRNRKLALQGKTRLFAVGNDEIASDNPAEAVPGETITGDVWLLSRTLETADGWFSKVPGWSAPVTAVSSEKEIESPILITDTQRLTHLFWVQPGSDPTGTGVTEIYKNIYYSRLVNDAWARPVEILRSTSGDINNPAVTINSRGVFLVVWSNGRSGELIFTRADTRQAATSTDWASPTRIPVSLSSLTSPDITSDAGGNVFVAYNLPSNEGRGIYLVKSTDNGLNWGKEVKVFDGFSAGWERVDKPKIAVSEDGTIHLMWGRSNVNSALGVQEVNYTQSRDGGQTWSGVEKVAEGRTEWISLVNTSTGIVHRTWLQNNTGRGLVWNQYSLDKGKTWSQAANVSISNIIPGIASLCADGSGQIHLAHLTGRANGGYSLIHWVWSRERWTRASSLEFDRTSLQKAKSLSITSSQAGRIVILANALTVNPGTGAFSDELVSAARPIDLPAVTPIPTRSLTEFPKATSPGVTETTRPQLATPTSIPPTPTAVVVNTPIPNPPAVENIPSNFAIIAVVGGLLLLSGIVLLVLLRKRSSGF